jgi:magnesium chelatase family protein
MYASTISVALVGGEAVPVQVEAYVGRAKDHFRLTGLPDTALRESKDRVRVAIASSGIEFPHRELTINLAPADLPKRGSDYDLPIAIGILAADRHIKLPGKVIAVGELALDGKVRGGVSSLGAAVLSAKLGIPCLVASENAPQVARVSGSQVFAVDTLRDAIAIFRQNLQVESVVPDRSELPADECADMAEVKGQLVARRALEIAAAGGHHLLFFGPPGGGKTMLAQRLAGLLPRLDDEAAIEVALIQASVGLQRPISDVPPFRAPHHSATRAALVGGGSGQPTPGEISLAHRGVLFLDEMAEFPRSHLDALRQPLEEGRVLISRQGVSALFPSRFQLVGASNPCPCGYFGDRRRPCSCSENVRARYRQRVSGPLFDRFDLSVWVSQVEVADFRNNAGEASSPISKRVDGARAAQWERGTLNRDLSGTRLDWVVMKTLDSRSLVANLEKGTLTARGAVRVRRVARTIADLEGEDVKEGHIAEALSLRGVW